MVNVPRWLGEGRAASVVVVSCSGRVLKLEMTAMFETSSAANGPFGCSTV